MFGIFFDIQLHHQLAVNSILFTIAFWSDCIPNKDSITDCYMALHGFNVSHHYIYAYILLNRPSCTLHIIIEDY